MRRYEVNIVLNPNLDQSQLALEKEIIQRALENYGARVEKVEELGLRPTPSPRTPRATSSGTRWRCPRTG